MTTMQCKLLIKTTRKTFITIQQLGLVVNYNIREWSKQFCNEKLLYTIFWRKIKAISSRWNHFGKVNVEGGSVVVTTTEVKMLQRTRKATSDIAVYQGWSQYNIKHNKLGHNNKIKQKTKTQTLKEYQFDKTLSSTTVLALP